MAKLGSGLAGELGIRRRDDRAAYDKAWRERNREKQNEYSRNYYHTVVKNRPDSLKAKNKSGSFARRKAKYGITREQYLALEDAQDRRCAICHLQMEEGVLRVDHDHNTGKVRGLLCSTCNTGIGNLRDSPELLRAAADYLEKQIGG